MASHICKGLSFGCRRGEGERLALYDGHQVDNQDTGCKNYDNLILVPNCDASKFYEYPSWKAQNNSEAKRLRTYVRSTVNDRAV
jgi:hypothetical protein